MKNIISVSYDNLDHADSSKIVMYVQYDDGTEEIFHEQSDFERITNLVRARWENGQH